MNFETLTILGHFLGVAVSPLIFVCVRGAFRRHNYYSVSAHSLATLPYCFASSILKYW